LIAFICFFSAAGILLKKTGSSEAIIGKAGAGFYYPALLFHTFGHQGRAQAGYALDESEIVLSALKSSFLKCTY